MNHGPSHHSHANDWKYFQEPEAMNGSNSKKRKMMEEDKKQLGSGQISKVLKGSSPKELGAMDGPSSKVNFENCLN